uniref:Uncharacterized protein n=1 Tax=Rhizophora mucronata TaxID=61149 RepID=A0A2P2PL45_RHIMU
MLATKAINDNNDDSMSSVAMTTKSWFYIIFKCSIID